MKITGQILSELKAKRCKESAIDICFAVAWPKSTKTAKKNAFFQFLDFPVFQLVLTAKRRTDLKLGQPADLDVPHVSQNSNWGQRKPKARNIHENIREGFSKELSAHRCTSPGSNR